MARSFQRYDTGAVPASAPPAPSAPLLGSSESPPPSYDAVMSSHHANNNNNNNNNNTATPPPNTADSTRNILQGVPSELQNDVIEGHDQIKKVGLKGHEARVCIALDVSASMENPNGFFSGINQSKVQRLIYKALSLGFLFDDNKEVEIFPFGDRAYPPIVINRLNYHQATELVLDAIDNTFKNETNYAEAVRAIRNHYHDDTGKRTTVQSCDKPPVFVIFITDGEPNREVTEAINEFRSASHQAIFWKFIALKGKQVDLDFSYLTNIHQNPCQLGFRMDIANLVPLDDPDELTMEKLVKEYKGWLMQAKKEGILTNLVGVDTGNVSLYSDGRQRSHANIPGHTHHHGSSSSNSSHDSSDDEDEDDDEVYTISDVMGLGEVARGHIPNEAEIVADALNKVIEDLHINPHQQNYPANKSYRKLSQIEKMLASAFNANLSLDDKIAAIRKFRANIDWSFGGCFAKTLIILTGTLLGFILGLGTTANPYIAAAGAAAGFVTSYRCAMWATSGKREKLADEMEKYVRTVRPSC